MRKLIIPAIVLGVFTLVAAGGVYLYIRNQAANQSQNTAVMNDTNSNDSDAMMHDEAATDDSMSDDATMMHATGMYTDYSPAAVTAAADKRIILFFYAGWCPSCREQDTNLQATVADIPADVVILKVDYDNSTALRQQYGVTLQHTFVQVDANGTQLKKWNSLYTEYDLQGILNKLV